MPDYSSPLLDQYNRDGIVTPGLRKAMDIFRSKQPNPAMDAEPYLLAPNNPGGDPLRVMPAFRPPTGTPMPKLPVPEMAQNPGPATSTPAPAPVATPPQAPPHAVSPDATAHQQELTRLTTGPTGKSGIAQIHNPWLRGLATAGDIGLSTFLPSAAIFTPGTQLHHGMLVNQAKGLVDLDDRLANSEERRHLEHAQATEQESLPEFHEAQTQNAATKAENERLKADAENQRKTAADTARNTANASREAADLRKHGLKKDEQGNVVPISEEEMTPAELDAHHLSEARHEYIEAQKGLAEARRTNMPEQLAMAQRRLDTASGNLSMRQKEFQLRAGGQPEGEALPGQIVQDGRTVGSAFQGNVKPTENARQAGERADTMMDIDARIRKALQNPEIAKGTGPIMGRLSEAQGRLGTLPHDLAELKNDLVSYGAFQAGLHPVRGIGALEYFDKVMGGLGQTPEELLGKLDSNRATAHSVQNQATRGQKTGGEPQRPKGVPDSAKWNPQTRRWEAP